MMRLKGWEKALGNYLESCSGVRFRYGTLDCCKFAAGALRVMLGIDPMEGINYLGSRGALKELRTRGGLEKAVAEAGFESIPVLKAGRGDLVLADLPGACVGIVGMDGWNAFFCASRGLLRIPLKSCRLAWRI